MTCRSFDMRTGGKTRLEACGACIAAGLTLCLGLANATAGLRVAITDDAVTIKADNTSIRSVLEELSRQTDLAVISREALDESVSIEINEATLPQAIRRLLRHKSFLLQQPQDVVGSLWIFSYDADNSQHGWATQSTHRRDRPDREFIDYQNLVSSADAGDREEAMFGFGDIADSNSMEYLQLGLFDPDEGVREEAIQSFADLGGPESVMMLGIALNDSEADLRVDAVDALGEIGGQEAMKLLQAAMADENDTVREAAAEWLTELEEIQD